MRYHMNRVEQAITEPEELRGILRNGNHAVIALCRINEPYVVTLNYGYDVVKDALYFHCARKGLKLNFIEQNPRACATVIDDKGYVTGDCDYAFRSVVMWGEMRIVADLREKKRAIEILLNHLESDPEVIKRRSPITDQTYDKIVILRFDIQDITGKRRP